MFSFSSISVEIFLHFGDGHVSSCSFSRSLSETTLNWLSDVRLYDRTPSLLLCPVTAIMSCSSVLLWYKREAAVARREWLDLKPDIPAILHKSATVRARVLYPTGIFPYH